MPLAVGKVFAIEVGVLDWENFGMSVMFDRALSRPSAVWRGTQPLECAEQATYVVLGNPHGGTTLISGLLRMIGVFMGEQIDSWTQEDIAMRSDVPSELRAVVRRRNAAHDRWGWKCPKSVRHLDFLRSSLRNPHLIVVLRDPYATTWRGIAFERRDAIESFEECIAGVQEQIEIVKRYNVPVLFVSYEMATKKPEFLIEDLAAFLGVSPLEEPLKSKLCDFVKPNGGYGGFRNIECGFTNLIPRLLDHSSVKEIAESDFEAVEFVRPYALECRGTRWYFFQDDPHCFVPDADLVKLPGCRIVRFEILAPEGRQLELSFYLDIGRGLCEEDRVRFGRLGSGTWCFAVDFPECVGALRFDPDEAAGEVDGLVVSFVT